MNKRNKENKIIYFCNEGSCDTHLHICRKLDNYHIPGNICHICHHKRLDYNCTFHYHRIFHLLSHLLCTHKLKKKSKIIICNFYYKQIMWKLIDTWTFWPFVIILFAFITLWSYDILFAISTNSSFIVTIDTIRTLRFAFTIWKTKLVVRGGATYYSAEAF